MAGMVGTPPRMIMVVASLPVYLDDRMNDESLRGLVSRKPPSRITDAALRSRVDAVVRTYKRDVLPFVLQSVDLLQPSGRIVGGTSLEIS